MLEGSEYDERRHHQRTPVSTGVIAVLITCCPEIIGSVSDISLGGAKIVYHHPDKTKIDCSAIKVDLISDDRFVEALESSHDALLPSVIRDWNVLNQRLQRAFSRNAHADPIGRAVGSPNPIAQDK